MDGDIREITYYILHNLYITCCDKNRDWHNDELFEVIWYEDCDIYKYTCNWFPILNHMRFACVQ